MGCIATLVYFATIAMIWSQLSEPVKQFMGGETGRFWSGMVIYTFALFLATVMPIFCAIEAVQDATNKRKGDRWFMTVIFIISAFAAYPLVVHAITTISQSGLNLVQFKESVIAMLDFKNIELGWYGLWYGMAFFIYGTTAAYVLVFGLAITVLIAVMWGWNQVIKLVIDFPE